MGSITFKSLSSSENLFDEAFTTLLPFSFPLVSKFNGEIYFDESKPEGTARKLTNVSRLEDMGWKYNVELRDGLTKTYDWYLKNFNEIITCEQTKKQVSSHKL